MKIDEMLCSALSVVLEQENHADKNEWPKKVFSQITYEQFP